MEGACTKRYPNSATAAASSDEIQTLKIYERGGITDHTTDAHDDGLVGESEVEFQHHFFPNDGGLALSNEGAVGAIRKHLEGLDESGVGRVELFLSGDIVGVAVGVELVTAGAKVGRGQSRGDIAQETSGKVDDFREGEAKLASGGLVGVG